MRTLERIEKYENPLPKIDAIKADMQKDYTQARKIACEEPMPHPEFEEMKV